jgi:hypothetical protein
MMNKHPAAIAANAVGIHAAAMGKFGQCLERRVDDPFACAAIDLGDQTEATAVVLKTRVV